MIVASRPTISIFKATLILSVMLHGLILLALSGTSDEKPEKVRVIAKVDVVSNLKMLEKPKVTAPPRLKIPPPPPPNKPVLRPGWKGTRPGVGGDPAPAAKSLQMNLPKNQRPAVNPNSSVLRGKSIAGDPNRGTAFGDPDGIHGGTGTGGNGPGGTGGSGDGGQAVASNASSEEILRAGVIDCNGCHVIRADPNGPTPEPTRPLNLEMMSQSTGWKINQHPKFPGGIEKAEYEYELDPNGKILNIRVLKTSSDPQIREALAYFAAMAEWTPPGVHCFAVAPLKFHPPSFGP